MDKNRLRKLAKDKRFIPGIYNYCDRWCEKCSYTTRCLNYAMEKEDNPTNESYDLNNKKFWNKIHDAFQLAMEMIMDEADRLGIDLNNIDTAEFEAQEKRNQEKVESHPLSIESKKYFELVEKWFEESKNIIEEKASELVKIAEWGLEARSEKFAVELNDLTEIIRWYQLFIHVKLVRALHGKLSGEDDEEPEWSDADGSAKIALISIDRSIAAFGKLIEIFPGEEDNLLNILLILSRLSRMTEKVFPNARSFKRPGFDDN